MAPDHGNVNAESPATTSPATRNAPCEADSSAVDVPPWTWSVVTCQAPKLAPTPSSKSEISVVSGAAGNADVSWSMLRATR